MTLRLRLASYNIHAGIGTDGHFDLNRLVGILRRLDADIIGLQEVVSVGPDGCGLLEELAQGCGMQAYAGPTMMPGDAGYGNAMLTRHNVRDIKRLSLDYHACEPRGALSVQLDSPVGQPITIAVTHLGLRSKERRIQIRQLLDWLPPPPEPVIILGDFNEWLPWSRNMRLLRRRFGPSPFLATFPTHFPLFALDRILASPDHLLQTIERIVTSETRVISDHLPLLTELRLPDE